MSIFGSTYSAKNSAAFKRVTCAILALVMAFSLAIIPEGFMSQEAYAKDGNRLVVAIDPGHGGGEAGAYGNGVSEEWANWDIAWACIDELNTYYGVKVVITHDNTRILGRQERVDVAVAQKADVLVSIHCNSSSSSSANGCEAWVPNESSYLYETCHTTGYNLAAKILNKLSALGLSYRGVYTRDCTDGETYPNDGGICDYYGINYWSRWRGIPGIIIEHAFVSNSYDASYLDNDEWRTKLGIADAQGIAEYYGLSKTPPVDTTANTGTVTTEIPSAVESDPAIMGTAKTTVDDMVAYFNESGASYPSSTYTKYGAATIKDFCTILYEEATAEGVRPEVAFCQSMKETGWLKFGGQVKPEWCNFAGLGAVDGGTDAAKFNTNGANSVRIGLRAQVQHLKAYGSTEALKNTCVDPRFNLVSPRGKAPTVSKLSGTWASDKNYGAALTTMINKLLDASDVVGPVTVKMNMQGVTGATTAYVDGVAQTIGKSGSYGTVTIPSSGTHTISVYSANATNSDPHKLYPTHMYTWIAQVEGNTCKVTRYNAMDDLLRYGGSSIRITGKHGIRLITGMDEDVKAAISDGNIAGFSLVETGTLIAWAKNVENGSLTFDTKGVTSGSAYVKGSKDPVFATEGKIQQYTNVLVGFTMDQCKDDLSMRPYAIMRNSSGDEIVVYGGTVQRSIGYIANQNAEAFSAGSDAYNFVHSIIDACK